MTKPSGGPKIVHYEAAGGVVVHDGLLLLLDRPSRNEVRLPKGHIDPGEDARTAALREVTEESGYSQLEVVDDLGVQTVEFDYEGKHVVRTEHYFLMRLAGEGTIDRDEKDRAQFAVRWVAMPDAAGLLTFAAEQEVVRRAASSWQRLGSAPR